MSFAHAINDQQVDLLKRQARQEQLRL